MISEIYRKAYEEKCDQLCKERIEKQKILDLLFIMSRHFDKKSGLEKSAVELDFMPQIKLFLEDM